MKIIFTDIWFHEDISIELSKAIKKDMVEIIKYLLQGCIEYASISYGLWLQSYKNIKLEESQKDLQWYNIEITQRDFPHCIFDITCENTLRSREDTARKPFGMSMYVDLKEKE